MSPSIPSIPNLKDDPKFAGAINLDDVRAKADREKAEQDAASAAAAQEYVQVWLRNMKRTFKGINGGGTLDRRFRMRAMLKRMERDENA